MNMCVMGKPSSGSGREPPPPSVCRCGGQQAECCVSWKQWWELSQRKCERERDHFWNLYNRDDYNCDDRVVIRLDPSRETNGVDIASCSQYANLVS